MGSGSTPPHTCTRRRYSNRPGLDGEALVLINELGTAPGPALARINVLGPDVRPWLELPSLLLCDVGLPQYN